MTRNTHFKSIATTFALLATSITMQAQSDVTPSDTLRSDAATQKLKEASVSARRKPLSRLGGVENGYSLSRQELFKAACCNLGESFTTNPSVDVSYTDAATGAKQIKLLGLSGTYVQMLTENVPAFRGAAAPYSLGYVPGPWMQSIQVSKGAASVKNGFESITGQINVEYKKPQTPNSLEVNLFGDSKSRMEANFDGNIHLKERLSTAILAHYEDTYANHDGNHDGFIDKANVRQYNLQNRWAWMGDRYIFQAALNALGEQREGGQTTHAHLPEGSERYLIGINTHRYSGFMKNAFVLDKDHGTNIALILSGALHHQDAAYGHRIYDVRQREGYASLMFETNFTPLHSLSAGMSVQHDRYDQDYRLTHDVAQPLTSNVEDETVPGLYAQYTFNLSEKFTLMGGLRFDHSNLYGNNFLTPRFHLKYAPSHAVTFRLSAGKGYRTLHPLADFNYLMASGRELQIGSVPQREEAWNYGGSANFKIPLFGHILDLGAEYYYTHFIQQLIVDMDADINAFRLSGLNGGRSYSHTMQLEASYPLLRGLSITAAYRYNLVKQTTAEALREKPLTNRYKALFTASYKTPLELWQFDITASLNGGGRLPLQEMADGSYSLNQRFPAYAQLSAQITRWFRHCSIYLGGENLTNYRQDTPILHADHPWSNRFDATQVWGPVHGAMVYAGVRFRLGGNGF